MTPASLLLRSRLRHAAIMYAGIDKNSSATKTLTRSRDDAIITMPKMLREQQHVVLALVIAAFFDLVRRQQHDDVSAQQEQRLQHEAEVVDDVAVVEHRPDVAADHAEGDDRQQRAEQHEARQRCHDPPPALADEEVDEQHHADPGTEHDLGRERVIVDRR